MTKIKIRRKRLKGNDSSSRRRRQQRERILTIAIPTACCIFILFIFGLIPWPGGKGNIRSRSDGIQLRQHKSKARGKVDEATLAHSKHSKKHPKASVKKRNAAAGPNGLLHMRKALEDPSSDPVATEQAREILSASTNLIQIEFNSHHLVEDDSYEGIVAVFCPLHFAAQKKSPSDLPMFKDLLGRSGCDKKKNNIRVDLKEAVDLVREFDVDNVGNLPTVLNLKGVVFHESRCGSTLAANSMMALNPKKHRVYSESAPPVQVFKICGENYSNCSLEASANLLKDVIYMMGRSNDPNEENLFYKFQSTTTRNMGTFRAAFPTTPWIFLYREPVQVMMSQLNIPGAPGRKIPKPNCVKSKNSSPIRDFIAKTEYDFQDFSDEEFCAVHLATLCGSALQHIEDADGLGMAVNYSPDLVHDFLDTIFPKHFHTPVDKAARDRVLEISGTYSKNRGSRAKGEFVPDSEEKEQNASEHIKEAAELFLAPVFKKLQESEHNIDPKIGDSSSGD